MTTASTPTADERLELSTEHAVRFLTGAEIRRVEADPYLTLTDVWGGR